MRFGVAMDATLLEDFDQLVRARGGTRSEILRDLARSEVQKARSRDHRPAVGTLTLVYDHHVRDLTERLTEMQHALGEKVRSTLHVHLDHHRCLEVVVLRGFADEIRSEAERLLATRGVIHGGLELYADRDPAPPSAPSATTKGEAVRGRAHGHERGARTAVHHTHGDDHVHDRGPSHPVVHAKPSKGKPAAAARPPKRAKARR